MIVVVAIFAILIAREVNIAYKRIGMLRSFESEGVVYSFDCQGFGGGVDVIAMGHESRMSALRAMCGDRKVDLIYFPRRLTNEDMPVLKWFPEAMIVCDAAAQETGK
jgi:hypothetical protein